MNRTSNKNKPSDGLTQEESIKKTRQKNKKKKIIKFTLIIIVIILLICFINLMVSLFRFRNLAKEMIQNMPSTVVDSSGNVIEQIGTERNRDNVSMEEMPDNLINAYVAIEDQRFYSHIGIDVKRTAAATLNYIISFGNASFGGSTITQQLVKNLTGNTDSTISRKVDEWTKALMLEVLLTKDEILEAYLNIIYVGPNIYGVQMGAEYYFDKSVSELSLAECAYLAGINNSPNSYNPFRDEDNSEKIENRTFTVLSKMLELGYITEGEYEEAKLEVESGLNFKRGDIDVQNNVIYSYHTDALISELISDIADSKNITETFAENYLFMANLTIYSTQDTDIQETMEEEFDRSKYILTSSSDNKTTSQAAMVIIDHSTGDIVGCVRWSWKKNNFKRI